MSNQFDWHIEEEPEQPHNESNDPKLKSWLRRLLLTAVFIGMLYFVGQQTISSLLNEAELALQDQVQAQLDLQRTAFWAGDGDLFFAQMQRDASWRFSQLQPAQQAAWRAGYQASRAEQREDIVWATLDWTIDGETYQRVAFYQRRAGQLVELASDIAFWGAWEEQATTWGRIRYRAKDAPFVPAIDRFMTEQIATLCQNGCVQRADDIFLTIDNSFEETAVFNQINQPSPRLVGLTLNTSPSDLFWTQLEQQLADRLAPATIRFGYFPEKYTSIANGIDHLAAAEAFMAENPHLSVELIELDPSLPLAEQIATHNLDGASLTPTPHHLAKGLVRDLTAFSNSSNQLNAVDFYEQIWPGGFWEDRLWMVPQTAEMNLLYYDMRAYEAANEPEPSLRWTWEEMEADITAVLPNIPSESSLEWGMLDRDRDLLYSYAYNWNNDCTERTTVRCKRVLEPAAVAATLEWYLTRVGQPQGILDLSGLDAAERQTAFLSSQSARRHSLIWVEQPLQYEYHLLLAPIGVAPFPGSDRFDGITPIHVSGGVIFAQSERPFATWQWLMHLTYERPSVAKRFIPARPSVAAQVGFWDRLPLPLSNAMRTAFPFARPILISEQGQMNWDQLTAVVDETLTPNDAARLKNEPAWFAP